MLHDQLVKGTLRRVRGVPGPGVCCGIKIHFTSILGILGWEAFTFFTLGCGAAHRPRHTDVHLSLVDRQLSDLAS